MVRLYRSVLDMLKMLNMLNVVMVNLVMVSMVNLVMVNLLLVLEKSCDRGWTLLRPSTEQESTPSMRTCFVCYISCMIWSGHAWVRGEAYSLRGIGSLQVVDLHLAGQICLDQMPGGYKLGDHTVLVCVLRHPFSFVLHLPPKGRFKTVAFQYVNIPSPVPPPAHFPPPPPQEGFIVSTHNLTCPTSPLPPPPPPPAPLLIKIRPPCP